MLGFVAPSARAQPPAMEARDPRPGSFAQVASDRISSVLFLHTETQTENDAGATTLGDAEGIGSGVILDDLSVLTNAHVVAGARVIHGLTHDGERIGLKVVGRDVLTDLALLEPERPIPTPPAPIGDSASLRTGDWVLAIGNPFGLHHAVTAGIVSGRVREWSDPGLEYLQTDAATNPGSSGGGLFDTAGRLVGITTGMLSRFGESLGANFAVPMDVILEVLPRLRAGDVVHGWIGVTTQRLTKAGVRWFGLTADREALLVVDVNASGPAAGRVNVGDVITGAQTERGAAVGALSIPRWVRTAGPGTALRLRIWRDKSERLTTVTLSIRPAGP